jgi:DNA-binding NarL/FixJ family response regulator
MSIRILLADDHRIVRDGLSALIEKQAGMEVVAAAENGQGAVRLARELKPDVIIMDIHMPDLSGIDATGQILSDTPAVKVIALSMYSDKQFVQGMFKAGATGYLLKDCAFEELSRAIHLVTQNQTYLGSGVEDNAAADPG